MTEWWWAPFCLGIVFGMMGYRALSAWRALYRPCCREHYETHATCPCWACVEDRENDAEEEGAS